jgi:hypothetical protein
VGGHRSLVGVFRYHQSKGSMQVCQVYCCPATCSVRRRTDEPARKGRHGRARGEMHHAPMHRNGSRPDARLQLIHGSSVESHMPATE